MGLFDIFKKNKLADMPEQEASAATAEPCNNNTHDFVKTPENNQLMYRCRKCGLSVSELPEERINMAYLGSYIENCTWVWKQEDMSWDHLRSFFISINNFESWSYHVIFEGTHLVWKKSALWRPDLPKNFFVEKKKKLTRVQQRELYAALENLDCAKCLVKPEDFDIQIVPSMFGKTYAPVFRCTFQNGRSFESGKNFEGLSELRYLLLRFMGIKIRDNR